MCQSGEQMLSELEREGREEMWIKVPSHIVVDGNHEADRLATVGPQSHHLYPFKHAPQKGVHVVSTPQSALKRAKDHSHMPTPMDVAQRIECLGASPKAISFDPLCASLVLHS